MKLCDTCIYRNENEYHKPCIVYRDNCEFYEREGDMTKVYELPNKHRLVADIDESTMTCNITETQLNSIIRDLNYYADKCEEYEVQEPKTGHWKSTIDGKPICSECGFVSESEDGYFVSHYCPNCGCRMVEPQESEEQV